MEHLFVCIGLILFPISGSVEAPMASLCPMEKHI